MREKIETTDGLWKDMKKVKKDKTDLGCPRLSRTVQPERNLLLRQKMEEAETSDFRIDKKALRRENR